MENWYAINFFPGFEEKIIKTLDEAATSIPAEINIFNPYYISKEVKSDIPMKSQRRRQSINRVPVYEGYMFVFIDEYDFPDLCAFVRGKLKKTALFLNNIIQEEEIDRAYETTLKLKRGQYLSVSAINKRKLTKESIGSGCSISSGSLSGMKGKIKDLNKSRDTVIVELSILGRTTTVEFPPEVIEID